MTKKILFTPENPKGIISDMTAEEIQQAEQDVITGNNVKNEEQAKVDAQVSGNQKLLDLGLTQAEATALTGYTPPSED
jgi:hypothetical protein